MRLKSGQTQPWEEPVVGGELGTEPGVVASDTVRKQEVGWKGGWSWDSGASQGRRRRVILSAGESLDGFNWGVTWPLRLFFSAMTSVIILGRVPCRGQEWKLGSGREVMLAGSRMSMVGTGKQVCCKVDLGVADVVAEGERGRERS